VTMQTQRSAQHVIDLIRIVLRGTLAIELKMLGTEEPPTREEGALLVDTLQSVREELDHAEKQIPSEAISDARKALDLGAR